MGLLKKKQSASTPPSPTRLRAFQDEDLYLFMESTLMNAQQRLAEYRKSDFLARPAALEMLEDQVTSAIMGCQEMVSRL